MRTQGVVAILLISSVSLIQPAQSPAQQNTPPTQSSAPATVLWCAGVLTMYKTSVNVEEQTYLDATNALCHGKFALARDRFARILHYRVFQSDGSWSINTQRGYFYSLIAARDDTAAWHFLKNLEADVGKWQPHPADRLFWSGKGQEAFVSYAAAAGSLEGAHERDSAADVDPNIVAASQTNGDWDTAISLLQKPSGASGSSSVKSLQLLMLGDAYEQQRRWREAFTAWVRAADSGHAVPEWDYIDDWNFSALEMIYYYRAHVPGDQRL